jgi:transcriptional regulator with XRE-family HTH domain
MAAEHVARIGARIRERRDELNLTQRELADLIPGKADGNQVSKWERGEHRVSDDTLEHIAAALQTDVAYFIAPAPRAGSPDLMGTLREADATQLDRIERMLSEVLQRLTAVEASVADALVAEITRAQLPLDLDEALREEQRLREEERDAEDSQPEAGEQS